MALSDALMLVIGVGVFVVFFSFSLYIYNVILGSVELYGSLGSPCMLYVMFRYPNLL